jgi:diadenosine tetraphosphate (Ap4A) HIT family hydrolase
MSPFEDELRDTSSNPPEQFYETKLFRVMVARHSLGEGHVIIERKANDPHFYSMSLDEMEEFSYLIKKVSFWIMRLTRAQGFTLLMNDGTPEVASEGHLQAHLIPRPPGEATLAEASTDLFSKGSELNETEVRREVSELQNMMQLPQKE